MNPNSEYKWQQGNWHFYSMAGHWAAPKTVLLWRQRGLKFHYSSRTKAVSRRAVPMAWDAMYQPYKLFSVSAMTTSRKITIYFVSISIPSTNSKSQPPDQRQTHFQPTDLKTSWCLSSPNPTDIIKFQAFVQYISDILWPCHLIQVTKRI